MIRSSSRARLGRLLRAQRLGAATLDYLLLLCVIFPLVAFVVPTGKKIIQFAYEMACMLIAWPFM